MPTSSGGCALYNQYIDSTGGSGSKTLTGRRLLGEARADSGVTEVSPVKPACEVDHVSELSTKDEIEVICFPGSSSSGGNASGGGWRKVKVGGF